MPDKDDMRWFKQQFHEKINAAVVNTPFSLDFMTALACQETGEVWPKLRKKDLSVDRILDLCVGDTIDGRSAFPRSKAELVAAPNGQKMFDIARAALVDMAQFITDYQKVAQNPDKFCHGFGIFQYDIQFFKNEDPDYFLQRRYTSFDASLGKALSELKSAAKKIGLHTKPALSDMEMTFVAIAYNTGGFNPAKGLKQGFRPKDKNGIPVGLFYGEQTFQFIQTSKTVPVDDAGPAPTPDPAGLRLKVTSTDPLRLRNEAVIDPTNANVLTRLPNGHVVSATTNQVVNGFLEVETDFDGKHFKGFASAQLLKQV
ncbi:MAG: hypothetical protein QOI77_1601 [Blastocatellia bacterium]|nr:hypothetical protein [Blastocatellia bacterium]